MRSILTAFLFLLFTTCYGQDSTQVLSTSMFDKDNQWILRNKEAIVWVIGRRIDDRYKITTATKNVCIIELTN